MLRNGFILEIYALYLDLRFQLPEPSPANVLRELYFGSFFLFLMVGAWRDYCETEGESWGPYTHGLLVVLLGFLVRLLMRHRGTWKEFCQTDAQRAGQGTRLGLVLLALGCYALAYLIFADVLLRALIERSMGWGYWPPILEILRLSFT